MVRSIQSRPSGSVALSSSLSALARPCPCSARADSIGRRSARMARSSPDAPGLEPSSRRQVKRWRQR
eukprot:3587954-Pyramimonas_sp.AAC.1